MTIDSIPTEGPIAKTIEQHTARMPSDWFLWAAAGSIATALVLQVGGKQQASSFVSHWAPTFLILGVYNKLVKQLGSDHTTRRNHQGQRFSEFTLGPLMVRSAGIAPSTVLKLTRSRW